MQAVHRLNTDVEPDTRPWFAVRVKSNREKVTANALQGQGYESFLPLYRPSKTVSERLGTHEAPLFPGYVFARFDKDKRLPILMLPGVVHVVGIGREPAPLDNSEIASIRAIVNSPMHCEPFSYLGIGERISLVSGPLSGVQGVVLAIKNGWRLVASITLLQRSISVEIDRAWVERSVQVPAESPHDPATIGDRLQTSEERSTFRRM